jgi:aminocarboxymuconate-semialdehyde decarboxylase
VPEIKPSTTDRRPAAPIDVHAHWYPREFTDLLRAQGADHGMELHEIPDKGLQFKLGHLTTGPLGPLYTDLDARLQAMDRQGVAVHALSLSQPMLYWAGRSLGEKLGVAFNEGLARAHETHSRRFVGLATMPLHEPDLAVRELDRVAKLPGIRGVYAATQVNGKELSDSSFFPVFERIEALGLPLFLHPNVVVAAERLTPFYLTNLLGNPFEAAIAAAHLIFGGVLDRFPRLDVVLPHAGGAFPSLVWRLRRGWEKREDLKKLAQDPSSYLRRFHYDTIGYSDHIIDYLIRVVGADRILMGSDYCFPIAVEQPVDMVTANPSLDTAACHAIAETNARRLLRLP